jgi:hypothetical protein
MLVGPAIVRLFIIIIIIIIIGSVEEMGQCSPSVDESVPPIGFTEITMRESRLTKNVHFVRYVMMQMAMEKIHLNKPCRLAVRYI